VPAVQAQIADFILSLSIRRQGNKRHGHLMIAVCEEIMKPNTELICWNY